LVNNYNRSLLNGKSLIFKMAAWRPQNRSNRKNKKTPSFIEIALAVTKCALLTDDDRCHVITRGELNMDKPFYMLLTQDTFVK
jgi:hypothetical protein